MTRLASLVRALELRDNPQKMAEYIKKNREFFPKVRDDHLKELESEKNINTK